MHDALAHGQSEPLFHTHLTDNEIAAVTGLSTRSVKDYRHRFGMPFGKRHPFKCQTFSGRTIRIARNYTPFEDVRAWLEAHRPQCLPALDKLIADKMAASSEQGE